jgi:hypothetical protein
MSASEIAIKEVLRETGVECEPVSLIAIARRPPSQRPRADMLARLPLPDDRGAEGPSLETSAVGFFLRRDAAAARRSHRWLDLAFF